MKKLLVILLTLFSTLPLWAESKAARDSMRHEIRLGWGDQLFERFMWHGPTYYTLVPESAGEIEGIPGPLDYRQTYNENYRYFQHYWLEYHYRFSYWFSMGALIDGSGVRWNEVTRDGFGNEVARDAKKHFFYNVVVMPTMRFTYFHHDYVNLYTGFGIGLDINGGTEKDIFNRYRVAAPAFDITILGLSANYKRYFMAVEYGGMYALRGKNAVYMAKSRMFTASFGVRF